MFNISFSDVYIFLCTYPIKSSISTFYMLQKISFSGNTFIGYYYEYRYLLITFILKNYIIYYCTILNHIKARYVLGRRKNRKYTKNFLFTSFVRKGGAIMIQKLKTLLFTSVTSLYDMALLPEDFRFQ